MRRWYECGLRLLTWYEEDLSEAEMTIEVKRDNVDFEQTINPTSKSSLQDPYPGPELEARALTSTEGCPGIPANVSYSAMSLVVKIRTNLNFYLPAIMTRNVERKRLKSSTRMSQRLRRMMLSKTTPAARRWGIIILMNLIWARPRRTRDTSATGHMAPAAAVTSRSSQRIRTSNKTKTNPGGSFEAVIKAVSKIKNKMVALLRIKLFVPKQIEPEDMEPAIMDHAYASGATREATIVVSNEEKQVLAEHNYAAELLNNVTGNSPPPMDTYESIVENGVVIFPEETGEALQDGNGEEEFAEPEHEDLEDEIEAAREENNNLAQVVAGEGGEIVWLNSEVVVSNVVENPDPVEQIHDEIEIEPEQGTEKNEEPLKDPADKEAANVELLPSEELTEGDEPESKVDTKALPNADDLGLSHGSPCGEPNKKRVLAERSVNTPSGLDKEEEARDDNNKVEEDRENLSRKIKKIKSSE